MYHYLLASACASITPCCVLGHCPLSMIAAPSFSKPSQKRSVSSSQTRTTLVRRTSFVTMRLLHYPILRISTGSGRLWEYVLTTPLGRQYLGRKSSPSPIPCYS